MVHVRGSDWAGVQVWDFETLDNAENPSDESGIFEMEPMNELMVGHDVQIRCIVKSVDPEETTMWYAQVRTSQAGGVLHHSQTEYSIVLTV